MKMEEFEQLWVAMQEAFRRNNKIGAIKLIRGLTDETMSLVGAKGYIDRHWSSDGLEAMKTDFQEKPATVQPIRIIQNANFSLTVKKEGVSWDDLNEFFDQVSRELGL